MLLICGMKNSFGGQPAEGSQQPPVMLLCKKKITKFYRKTPMLESLFNKIAGLKVWNFIKKRLQYKCFPVKIC